MSNSKRRSGDTEPPAAKRARGADDDDDFVDDVVNAALADSVDSEEGSSAASSSAPSAAKDTSRVATARKSGAAAGGAGAGAGASAGAGAGAGAGSSSGAITGAASGGAGSRGVSAARYAVAKDAAAVLRRVVALAEEGKAKAAASAGSDGRPRTLADLGIEGAHEVGELTPDEVMDGIEAVLGDVTSSIIAGEGFAYAVPSRSASHQRYVPELDRIVLMRDKDTVRSFTSVATVRKATIMTRAMGLIYDVLRKGIHITKRDLFYTDVKLFTDQKESDAVLDDVASMVGCTRTSLHVVASDKGIVVGRVSFRDDGDLIDCTRMGIGGKAIPPFIDRITDVASDAKFILLVEKEAAFMRIAEDRFYNKYPCIVITAKGQPDVATRLFLKKLKTELKLPVLGLVDSDPYGETRLVYMCARLVSSLLLCSQNLSVFP